MRLKILSALAAALLVAACASSNKQAATNAGAGETAAVTGPTAGSVAEFTQNVGDRVFFDLDKFNLKPEAQATLQKQAAWLVKYPQYKVTVEGHCDERGTREYNLALGERRANSVTNYLAALGVDKSRINTISYGKERPAVEGHDETAWAQNRRGVTVLSQ
jgi:peptidoglycan-associated lipoprotein